MSAGLQPPGLDRDLDTEERALRLSELLAADHQIHELSLLAQQPSSAWPADVRHVLQSACVPGESVEQRLLRWNTLFREEAELVRETRNRLVHQVRVGDAELLRAHWLAHHVLKVALGSRLDVA